MKTLDKTEPPDYGDGLMVGNGCDMSNEIDRLTSRHIAKLLSRLGPLIPPVAEQEIKRQFRFLADDIKSVTGENNELPRNVMGG